MTKHTLKILRCSHRKVFKYVWPFYNIMHERVKRPNLVMIFKLLDNILDCIIRIASRLFDKMYFQECFHYIWKTLFKLTRCYNNVFNIWSLVFFVKKFTFEIQICSYHDISFEKLLLSKFRKKRKNSNNIIEACRLRKVGLYVYLSVSFYSTNF